MIDLRFSLQGDDFMEQQILEHIGGLKVKVMKDQFFGPCSHHQPMEDVA